MQRSQAMHIDIEMETKKTTTVENLDIEIDTKHTKRASVFEGEP